MKIKNWSEFQHFKDRTPPWIKLYRYLLDDPEWHALSGEDAKRLIMIWLVASEDKNMNGNLPTVKNLAFRLRITEKEMNQTLNRLSDWLIQDDDMMISSCYQVDAPETETETETEKRQNRIDDEFELFWKAYPKKKDKAKAKTAWKKVKPPIDSVLNALEWQVKQFDWTKENGKFVKYPERYITAGSWQDEQQRSEIDEWLNEGNIEKEVIVNDAQWIEYRERDYE